MRLQLFFLVSLICLWLFQVILSPFGSCGCCFELFLNLSTSFLNHQCLFVVVFSHLVATEVSLSVFVAVLNHFKSLCCCFESVESVCSCFRQLWVSVIWIFSNFFVAGFRIFSVSFYLFVPFSNRLGLFEYFQVLLLFISKKRKTLDRGYLTPWALVLCPVGLFRNPSMQTVICTETLIHTGSCSRLSQEND